MKRRVRGFVSLVLATVSLIAIAAGCKDSNTITGNNSSVPTPTPGPLNVTGTWTGTWDPAPHFDCHSPAVAVLVQQGDIVTGTFSATSPCHWGGTFSGTLSGFELNGTFGGIAYANGTVSDKTITLNLGQPLTGAWVGKFRLHR